MIKQNYFYLFGLLCCLCMACGEQEKSKSNVPSYPTKYDLLEEKQAKLTKKYNPETKKTRDVHDSLKAAGYIGLWQYLGKFYKSSQPLPPNHISTYPLSATTHKAPYGERKDLHVYAYKNIPQFKIEVISNEVRNAFNTPPVKFNNTFAPIALDSVTKHYIAFTKKSKIWRYFAICRINNQSFALSDGLVPDTLTYFEYNDRAYFACARPNNTASGSFWQATTLHVFDVTNPNNIQYYKLNGRYQGRHLLYDYNNDGVLDYPVYEEYLCKGFEPLLCKEKTTHEICGRIYLKSLYPEGWKRLKPYGIYFYRDNPKNPYIYLKECARQWVD